MAKVSKQISNNSFDLRVDYHEGCVVITKYESNGDENIICIYGEDEINDLVDFCETVSKEYF